MSRPALLGGLAAAGADTYPSWPQWGEREREELVATLDSGAWWTGDGERAHRFARDFARYQGATGGYPFTNGTQTLEAALVACGVGEGDEVIVPAMTFVASASAVLSVNATPVIVDVDADTLCIEVGAAEAAIGERTRASIAVHVAGAVCDLDVLVPLCARRALHLVEDCAHAHGSQWRGRGAGSYRSRRPLSVAAGQADDRRGGRRADRQRSAVAGRRMELRGLRSRARALVLSPRHDRVELPHDRVAGRRAAGAAGTLSRAARQAQCERRCARRGDRRGAGPPRAEARRAHGQPGQLLLRRPLRPGRVRRDAAQEIRGGALRRGSAARR